MYLSFAKYSYYIYTCMCNIQYPLTHHSYHSCSGDGGLFYGMFLVDGCGLE